MKAASSRHGTSLAFGRLIAIRENEVAIAYTSKAGFHRTTVASASGRALIEKSLTASFKRPIRLLVEESDAVALGLPPSLAERDAESRVAYEKSSEQLARAHPAVRAALNVFGGEIEHIRVLEPAPVAQPDEPTEEAT